MSGLFDDRERAAESAFVHEEELSFVAHRRAIEALATWASESMGLNPEAARLYRAGLVDSVVANMRDEQIVERVQTDLERAGKPAMTTQVGVVLSRATASAIDALRGKPIQVGGTMVDPLDSFEQRHRQSSTWGSLKF